VSRAAKKKAKNEAIAASWELHNDDDISTERLLQMVADDCNVDTSRVIDGLVAMGVLTPA